MTAEFWRGKKVFLTGHTGFKGSWLSIWLKLLGAEVIGYSLKPPSIPNNFEVCGLEAELTHIHGDVRDYKLLLSVFETYRPEFVFHLAAQPLVRLSYQEPRLTYETNIMGTVNLLEAVRATESVRAVVIVTSDKCYENREWVRGYREDDSMGGHDPYSSSKGCAELVNSAYLRSYFSPSDYGRTHRVAIASVRAGNVIGGGDWGTDRLIPDCVRALSCSQEIVIRHPKAIRPWQHVQEPLSGYLLIGSKLLENGPRYCGAWNFGPMDAEVWTVEDVVKMVCKLWEHGKYVVDTEPALHEANWLKLDCSKARLELNWSPKLNISKTLKKTIEWYRLFYSNHKSEKLKALIKQQIREYTEK